MKELLTILGAIVGILALILILPLLGALFGAFCGWIVGIFWPNLFSQALAHFGMSAFAPYQIGAMLGFVGGFFKTRLINTKG